MITLLEKKYLQQSRVQRNLASSQEWPLVPFILSSRVNSSLYYSDATIEIAGPNMQGKKLQYYYSRTAISSRGKCTQQRGILRYVPGCKIGGTAQHCYLPWGSRDFTCTGVFPVIADGKQMMIVL